MQIFENTLNILILLIKKKEKKNKMHLKLQTCSQKFLF